VNALLLLMLAFPGQRFVNLPTGVLPEARVWQVCVSHRFYPSVTAPGWNHDPLQALTIPDVWLTLDRSLGERWLVGGGIGMTSKEIEARAAWAPLPWLTAYPELSSHLYSLKPDSTWFNVGLNLHKTVGEHLTLVAQPRYTTNSKQHFVSVGLAAGSALGKGYAVALEAEPVLLGRDSTTRQLACGLALQKQVGWHDFAITLGTALQQSAPAAFRSAGTPTAYSDVLDLLKGRVRLGFNLLRKI
jgi:hypothetical protein